jgi:hypothetical protein
VIIIKGTIKGHKAKLLLNSEVSTNYINETYTKKHNIPIYKINLWQTVQNFEGQITIKGYIRQTKNIMIRSGEYKESIQVDLSLFKRRDFDAILGMTWL